MEGDVVVDDWSLKEKRQKKPDYYCYDDDWYSEEDIDVLRQKLIEDLEGFHQVCLNNHNRHNPTQVILEFVGIINKRFGVDK